VAHESAALSKVTQNYQRDVWVYTVRMEENAELKLLGLQPVSFMILRTVD